MKIFLSAIENGFNMENLIKLKKKLNKDKFLYNLMSFYYYKKQIFEYVRDNSTYILIDSGAHSFQKGKKVNWEEYTKKYAEFIKTFDTPNVLGYFEMDVDNVIGYDKVLELRAILEKVSNKIIPVWHKNRGIQDFKDMCKKYANKIIAITGFKNEDIADNQYLMFLKYAKKFNCKVHCLGMTRKKILDTVPFDFVDSSSWKQNAIYGNINGLKLPKGTNHHLAGIISYLEGVKMQQHYYNKWIKYETNNL